MSTEQQQVPARSAGQDAKDDPNAKYPLSGLVPGRVVYFVVDETSASQINRRRTDGQSIADRMAAGQWPAGAMAHIGTVVQAGDIVPAFVIRVVDEQKGLVNLKVQLDGTDVFWAPAVPFDPDEIDFNGVAIRRVYTWHWMFREQNTRYTPNAAQMADALTPTIRTVAAEEARKLAHEIAESVQNGTQELADRVRDLVDARLKSAGVGAVSIGLEARDVRQTIVEALQKAGDVESRHGTPAAWALLSHELKRMLESWPA